MCEWYDVKVRGVLGSGGCDVREMEILERILRWTEEGMEFEAIGRHHTVIKHWDLCREPKTVHSAAVKAGGNRTRRRRANAGGNGEDEAQELGGDAGLHESDQVGRAIRR